MAEVIDAVRWAYVAASTGHAVLPDRIHLSPPGTKNVTLVMPAFVESSPDGQFLASLAVKTVSVYPENLQVGLAAILGGVLVLDPATGACLGLVDGASLTALRTGGGSAVASDVLALPDASTVAIFGSGAQAATQLQAICSVRTIRTAWIFSRTPAHAEQMCGKLAGQKGIPDNLKVARTANEAVAEADIICTATGSLEPLFDDQDLKPGVHINAIGAYRPDMVEIPATTVARARIFVDHLASALHEAGDLVHPIRLELIDETHIVGEIGSLVAGRIVGRRNDKEITLFKSVGMAAQDAVCASLALRNAELRGLGMEANLS